MGVHAESAKSANGKSRQRIVMELGPLESAPCSRYMASRGRATATRPASKQFSSRVRGTVRISMHLLDAPLAIVDLETTGADPASDRITEIAVLEVQGFEVTAEWSTLVNPGAGIPSPIQLLTGITNEMVAAAPRFADLAAALHERLAGRVFVAHNARFDYGFLRREFDRAGI